MNDFILTKEYKRFVEFCNTCKKEKYIGLCHGHAGVGKSMSAVYYANWHKVEAQLIAASAYDQGFHRYNPIIDMKPYNTIIYTPEVINSAKLIVNDIKQLIHHFSRLKERSIYGEFIPPEREVRLKKYVELLIIDEAERLQSKSLEQIRDIYDRQNYEYDGLNQIAVIFIGMPGIEKRLIRFPQLYSRIGFTHTFNPLSSEEISFIIEQHLKTLGIAFKENNFMDHEATAAVARITNGNFRLINRLLKQAIRIIEVNQLSFISKEVINSARECLVIGNS
ncbi:AAA family ATPase [Candidatus Lariskella endosymbiont of Epinotia ramella]|uniref:AAA family ATPase n=1 Tax=Candidatus Lariskella endosymbiont of Epinotia ramella TaxID=3066224 RepID=UPI0030CF9535